MNKIASIYGQLRKHFSRQQLAVSAASLLVMVVLVATHVELSFGSKEVAVQSGYTYDMALADARGNADLENGLGLNSANQLALLDPSLQEGFVLGVSTATEESLFPKAEEVLTPEVLAPIKIKMLNQTSPELLAQYALDTTLVESQFGSEQILLVLGSNDVAVLKDAQKKVEPLIANLANISVPKDLEEYHRLKILYYAELAVLAEGYAGAEGAADPKDTGIILFSIMDRMERIKSEISSKYGVQL